MADLCMFAFFYGDRLTQSDMLSRTKKLVKTTPQNNAYSPDFSANPKGFLDYLNRNGMPTPVDFINQYLALTHKNYSASRVQEMRSELKTVLTSENGIRGFLRSLESDISGLIINGELRIPDSELNKWLKRTPSQEEMEKMLEILRQNTLVGVVDPDSLCPFNYEWHKGI